MWIQRTERTQIVIKNFQLVIQQSQRFKIFTLLLTLGALHLLSESNIVATTMFYIDKSNYRTTEFLCFSHVLLFHIWSYDSNETQTNSYLI